MHKDKLKVLIKSIPLLSDIPLSSIKIKNLAGQTNNNYLLSTPEKEYVLRIPKEQTNQNINRNDEIHNTTIAYQLGLTPKTLWRDSSGKSLNIYINNARTAEKSDFIKAQFLEKLAKSLITLQNNEQPFKGNMDNQNIADHLTHYFKLCSQQQQNKLQDSYEETLQLLKSTNQADRAFVPSHIDFVKENILIQGNKLWLIDWEYSAMASPFWDIATFSNSLKLNEDEAGYFLKMLFADICETDTKLLLHYRVIVKTVSDCWHGAYNTSNASK